MRDSSESGLLTPFVDLATTHRELRAQLDRIFEDVLSSSGFIGGPKVEAFESSWAAYCGVENCVGVANGTDAIEMVLTGLEIGPGDDVIVPANTFVATAEAVVNVGARPVFCDVDDATLLMTARDLEAAATPATAAVIVVHLYGQMANMTELTAAASRLGIALIEDAAQAHGASWDERPAGSFGAAATFSFYPGKNLGALGDGGAVVTSDADLALRVRSIANHGRTDVAHRHACHGRNSRLDALQAAVLSAKLPLLANANAARRKASQAYRERLPAGVATVHIDPRALSSHHLEVIRVPDPEALARHLGQHRIPTGRHYGMSCTRQPAFAAFDPQPCPVAEAAVDSQLSLPMHPHLELEIVDVIVERVAEHLAS